MRRNRDVVSFKAIGKEQIHVLSKVDEFVLGIVVQKLRQSALVLRS